MGPCCTLFYDYLGIKVRLHCVKTCKIVKQWHYSTWTWSLQRAIQQTEIIYRTLIEKYVLRNHSLYAEDSSVLSSPKPKGQFGKSTQLSSMDGWTFSYISCEYIFLCKWSQAIFVELHLPIIKMTHFPDCTWGSIIRFLKPGYNLLGTYFLFFSSPFLVPSHFLTVGYTCGCQEDRLQVNPWRNSLCVFFFWSFVKGPPCSYPWNLRLTSKDKWVLSESLLTLGGHILSWESEGKESLLCDNSNREKTETGKEREWWESVRSCFLKKAQPLRLWCLEQCPCLPRQQSPDGGWKGSPYSITGVNTKGTRHWGRLPGRSLKKWSCMSKIWNTC